MQLLHLVAKNVELFRFFCCFVLFCSIESNFLLCILIAKKLDVIFIFRLIFCNSFVFCYVFFEVCPGSRFLAQYTFADTKDTRNSATKNAAAEQQEKVFRSLFIHLNNKTKLRRWREQKSAAIPRLSDQKSLVFHTFYDPLLLFSKTKRRKKVKHSK